MLRGAWRGGRARAGRAGAGGFLPGSWLVCYVFRGASACLCTQRKPIKNAHQLVYSIALRITYGFRLRLLLYHARRSLRQAILSRRRPRLALRALLLRDPLRDRHRRAWVRVRGLGLGLGLRLGLGLGLGLGFRD